LIAKIILGMFVAAMLMYTAEALRNGRAYYAWMFFRGFYVERLRHPKLFWLLVTLYVASAVMGVWSLTISK